MKRKAVKAKPWRINLSYQPINEMDLTKFLNDLPASFLVEVGRAEVARAILRLDALEHWKGYLKKQQAGDAMGWAEDTGLALAVPTKKPSTKKKVKTR